jgi:hypothetical protein
VTIQDFASLKMIENLGMAGTSVLSEIGAADVDNHLQPLMASRLCFQCSKDML